jgi:hypothetical protein
LLMPLSAVAASVDGLVRQFRIASKCDGRHILTVADVKSC